MDHRIKDVVILGGGTAGWMTAAYLGKALQRTARITVLEASAIPRIGVGEATVPNLQRAFFDYLGIAEEEWMRECNASYKVAVKFINWRTPGAGTAGARTWQGRPDHFFHPFGLLPSNDNIPLSHYWSWKRERGETDLPFDYACFKEPAIMDADLAPRWLDGGRATTYAWHRGCGGRPPRLASPEDYRDLMSAFPTGVAVVTSMDESGQPRGMTCSSLSSVTLAPPTLLTCLRTDSATLGAVRHHGGFAVNLLHARGRAAAELFSSAAQDRFGLIRWRPSYSGLPWLVADAFALAECTVSGLAEVGDHTVVFGAVDEVTVVHDTPLLYGMRQFSALCTDPCARRRPNGPGAR